eukprot:c6062_g1_i1 orf=285-2006(+)
MMERKKKREKPAVANGSTAEGAFGQSGDAHGWQREVEQQGNAKRLASSTTSDGPMQNCVPPSFNWSFAQHPSAAQQQSAHALMPQPHVQAVPQQQGAALQVPLQGGPQTLPPVSQLGWQNPDAFAQSAGPIHPPFQPGTGESSWPHGTAPGAQSLGGRPPPFPFPPPPYSGPWDPVSWWGHNPYQPPFPYLYPGYGGGYPCPMPPTPPIGPNQRGLIKPPPGLSQKHIRIWEAQSMENMQLWTTTTQLWAAVARSDAEIALQRTKILKLEADLQIIKAHRDGNVPQLEVPAALQTGSRRGRRKKATPAPVATAVSLPADSNALRAPGRKARAMGSKADPATNVKEMELEDTEKSTLGNHVPELVYRPSTDDRHQKNSSLTVGSLRNESPSQKHPLRQTLEFQSSTNNMAKDDLAFSHLNHLSSPFKPSSLIAGRKDNSFEQSLKESVAVSFLKNANNLDHQGVITGDMPFGAAINSGGLCPDTNGNMMAKDAAVRSQMQAHAHFNVHNIEKSISLRKPWQYTGEDGSDEQDEGGVSVQDDDDGDDEDDEDNENTLDDMHSEKVSNLWHSVSFR